MDEEAEPIPMDTLLEASSSEPLPYQFPSQDSETMASLTNLFPAATSAPVPVVKDAQNRAKSRYLMLWNLPAFYLWQHVVNWVCSILALINNPYLDRIVCTNESGFQIFWLRFRAAGGAQRFRGIVQDGTLGSDGILVQCDFVDQNEFNGANGRSADHWTYKGLSDNRSTLDNFSDLYCWPANAAPSLLSRLTMNLETVPIIPIVKCTSRPNRRRRNKKLLAAKGGAL